MARRPLERVGRLPGGLVYINGDLVPGDEATVSVFDSGFNFADGVFEGIRVYERRVFRLAEHLHRLYASAQAFEIDIGLAPNELTDEILRWLRAVGVENDFHFRPIVTRGTRFPPRLDPRFASGKPNIVFLGGPVAPVSSRGVRVVVSTVRRISPAALDPHVKSLSYGNNVLGRLDAHRSGADDALMLDDRGFLAEASAANLFLVEGEKLFTPTTYACLDGITRAAVIRLARDQGLAVDERDLDTSRLEDADELFLTGTGCAVLPIVELGRRRVGTGAAGPVTSTIAEAYEQLVRTEGEPALGKPEA